MIVHSLAPRARHLKPVTTNAPVIELQRACEHCGDLVPVHAVIRCGTHAQCAVCAADGFCSECKALLMEELQARADDRAAEVRS